jgi:hypothetical protein
MWHYPMYHHYLMCCLPYFPILILFSLYLVIFRHPYLTHTKSDFRKKISAMDLAIHFLHIYSLDFHLKKTILPSNFASYETLGFES